MTIEYVTSPDAIGLQWLDPAQTEGKEHPFLFTHFQPIHARTCMPVQDSPAGPGGLPGGHHGARRR